MSTFLIRHEVQHTWPDESNKTIMSQSKILQIIFCINKMMVIYRTMRVFVNVNLIAFTVICKKEKKIKIFNMVVI